MQKEISSHTTEYPSYGLRVILCARSHFAMKIYPALFPFLVLAAGCQQAQPDVLPLHLQFGQNYQRQTERLFALKKIDTVPQDDYSFSYAVLPGIHGQFTTAPGALQDLDVTYFDPAIASPDDTPALSETETQTLYQLFMHQFGKPVSLHVSPRMSWFLFAKGQVRVLFNNRIVAEKNRKGSHVRYVAAHARFYKLDDKRLFR